MRLLTVGKTATSDDLREWSFDGQGRLKHKPEHHGWHYAHAHYRVSTGRFEKSLYLCEKCGRGLYGTRTPEKGLV